MLDQRLLPGETVYREYRKATSVADAIQKMVIRGAPAIGIAAGYGLALVAFHSETKHRDVLVAKLLSAAQVLKKARPTAVNLGWAIDRILEVINEHDYASIDLLKEAIIAEALRIHAEDVEMNMKIGEYGQELLPDGANVIHHCNTGALATGGYGTALGVIRAAHEHGKKIHVFVDETRPRLQGARLTAWELGQLDIPYTVIVDGASGHVMVNKQIDACLVGCDRIARNGDVANKIGTYNLALVARAHNIPFYVVGPTSTIDLSVESGQRIPIEERAEQEITEVGNEQITPKGVKVYNPAFDITPAKWVTAIITNHGVASPPFEKSIVELYREGNMV
jgi:methylthioribose-1-phosphate isomerase